MVLHNSAEDIVELVQAEPKPLVSPLAEPEDADEPKLQVLPPEDEPKPYEEPNVEDYEEEGFAEDYEWDKFRDVKMVNGLPWGSKTFNDAVNTASNDINKANRFGVLYRPDMDRYHVRIGKLPIRSDLDEAVIGHHKIIVGEEAKELWQLLTQHTIKSDTYSIEAIYDYLVLMKTGDVRISPDTSKAKIIGEYIRKYTPEAIVSLGKFGSMNIDDDLQYYINLKPTRPPRRKKAKKGEGLKVNDTSDLAHELTRLVAAHKAGNTNTFNQINDILINYVDLMLLVLKILGKYIDH